MTDEPLAVLDTGHKDFAARPELSGHVAARAVHGLSRRGGKTFVVDRTLDRRALSGAMLLAVARVMAERWRPRLEDEPRVGVVFPAGIGTLVANLALAMLDKVPVNLNFTVGRAAAEKCIAKAGLRTILSAGAVKEKVPDFPWTEACIDLAEERKTIRKIDIILNLLAIRLLPASWLIRKWGVPTAGGGREAGLLFSSGSTGDPKGVALTHANIIGNCLQIESCGLLDARETMMACLPTFHSFGFTVTVWYPFFTGMRIVTLPSPLETRRVADAVEAEKVTVMMGTPTFFRPYFKRVEPAKLKSLRFVVGGAEKTPKGFHKKWETTFGGNYLEGYGLTETSPVVSCNLPAREGAAAEIREGSVGRLFPGMEARVVDPSTAEVKRRGELGILELKGVNVFGGYLDDPVATRQCFRDGWFVSGDLARIDNEGFFYIEGRLSRFSKLGGEMVPHGTVEQAIIEEFGLQDSESPLVAVTGVYDNQKGEALVVLAAVEIKPDALRTRLTKRGLPNLWIPRIIKRVDAIPCLASGKLDLRALNELAESA
ncbi:MAG: AMP-binding protein [Opitutales bacterium]|nr:AMP-binding protein [Opitutales bacterium]